MSFEYTYSLVDDFSNNINSRQLHNEVLATTGITSVFKGVGVNYDTGDVNIRFESILSGYEETLLDNLVDNYVIDTSKPKKRRYSIDLKYNEVNDNDRWKVIKTFNYAGKQQMGEIDYIEIISYKDSKIDSYDIKISIKDNIIASKYGLTNEDAEIIDLGTIDNEVVPDNKCKIDVEIKKNGGGKRDLIYIEDMVLFHSR